MPYVVSIAAVCPMRSQPSHKSEMVSQLLFGEVGEVLQDDADFTRIRCLYDGYEGWCAKSQLADVDTPVAFEAIAYVSAKNTEAYLNNVPLPLVLGTPVFNSTSFGSYTVRFAADAARFDYMDMPVMERIKHVSHQYLNTPYLWGGKSNFGIDCSGFTQQVLKVAGIALLRDAYLQATQGSPVALLNDAQCCDLAFFDNSEGHVTHVGILTDSSTVIHASGYVRVDKIDEDGIIHSITGKRTHRLHGIRRV